MSEPIINRVYDLKIAGYDDSIQKVKLLTTEFGKMDAAKKKLNEQLQKKLDVGDVTAVKELSARIKELETNIGNLSKKKESSARESALMAKAEKDLAAAEAIRTKSLIDQEKELDRLIAAEEKKNKVSAISARDAKAQSGNYYELLRAQREALELYRTTPADSPFFEEVKKGATEAKAKVDAFNRSLSPDGTLVGEYRTGIVNAFKELGLDDVIKKNKDDITNQLNQLKKQSQELAAEYRKAGAAGSESFALVEAQLKQNIEEQERLSRSLAAINSGSIGKEISGSIGGAFKSLKGDMVSAALAYVSFQGIISGVQGIFESTTKLDSLSSALKVVSGTERELAINNQFLKQTTEQLGLEYISTAGAFKNFYAASTQAGIGAEETRKIFFSASAAAANLKLSQEDTNGVLLAFSQIASKGKVQAEELRGQIGERVPGAFAIAAKAIGVTQVELNKMLEKGEVIASDFLPKFANELQNTFGGDANKKVVGLQASINDLKNQFTDLIVKNQAGLTNFFTLFLNGAAVAIKLLPLLVASLALYTAEQIRAYIATQLTTKGTIIYNTVLGLQKAYVIAANFFLTAYYGTIALLTGGLTRATAATAIFSNVMRAVPLGAILTLLGLLAAVVVAFANSVNRSTQALKDQALQQLALADVQKQSALIYSEQISKIDSWIAVVKSAATSADTKRDAVTELTKINKAFGDVIKDNVIDLNQLDAAYKLVTTAIISTFFKPKEAF